MSFHTWVKISFFKAKREKMENGKAMELPFQVKVLSMSVNHA